eukprot:637689-Rhodomonas_salina.2
MLCQAERCAEGGVGKLGAHVRGREICEERDERERKRCVWAPPQSVRCAETCAGVCSRLRAAWSAVSGQLLCVCSPGCQTRAEQMRA